MKISCQATRHSSHLCEPSTCELIRRSIVETYYCVKSAVDNHGRMTAAITESVEADTMPQGTFTATQHKDIYTDWFESREEAEQFVRDARCS